MEKGNRYNLIVLTRILTTDVKHKFFSKAESFISLCRKLTGCPIQVDILPKQVGKSVSTPIVSQQTTTIMPPGIYLIHLEQIYKIEKSLKRINFHIIF